MSERAEPPTRQEVAQQLRQLIAGTLTPEAVSAWASTWVTRLDEVTDARAREALGAMGAADMPSSDREYLYEQADFEEWLRELTR